jgi:hypothetical protein
MLEQLSNSYCRPFNCVDTFTPCIFLAYFGDMFFSLFSIIWRHSVTASCWISVAKFWSRCLILLFPQDNRTFGFSGINLCHLGAEFSILRCRKRFRGSITFKKIFCFFVANLGISCIPYTVQRCEKHVIERPVLLHTVITYFLDKLTPFKMVLA